jgi:hypothetical protein
MTDKIDRPIKKLPELPKEIIEANMKKELAIFIGAGISRFLGCTSWSKLAENLTQKCKDEGLINYLEQKMLSKEHDIKKTITICNHILNNDESFMEEMQKSLNDDIAQKYIDSKLVEKKKKKYQEHLEIYRDLFRLNGIFITTNADRHIDQVFEEQNIIYENFLAAKIDDKHLYKIHGSIINKESLIFTVDGYIEAYTKENFSAFLQKIFTKYTVLFVGYSLSEFELLDYLFKSTRKNNKKHFFLKNYFNHETKICEFDQMYFDKIGIKLIPYNIDENGHEQLKEIIKSWVEQIKTETMTLQNNFDDIDVALENPIKENIDNIIQKIKNDEEYRTYFFRNSPNYKNLSLWLEPLFKNSLHNLEDKNSLNFLEATSIQNKEAEEKNTTEILSQIVNNAIKSKSKDDYVNWYTIKIVFNLPKNYITLEHMDFLEFSIKNSWASSILDSEIEKIVLPVLVENKLKEHTLKLLDIIFGYTTTDESNRSRKPLIKEYWLNSLLKRYSQSIIELVQADGLDKVLQKLKDIYKKDKNSFNAIWVATIENSTQNSFPQRYDSQLISFIRDLMIELKSKQIEKYVENFLESEIVILRRVAFYVINQKYDDFKNIFWRWFDKNISSLNLGNKHEFYELIKNRSEKFSDEEFDKLLDWIENLNYSKYIKNDSEIEQEKYIAYKRKEWLLCLKKHNKKAKKLYDKYHNINPVKVEHQYSSGFKWIEQQNPIENMDKFCSQSVDGIINKIETFNPDKIKKGDFTDNNDLIESLASNLIVCIKKHPDKISKEIEKFENMDYIYKYNLIYGFKKAWEEHEKFDWGKVFDFISHLLNDDFFASKEQYALWLRGEIANLIQEGTKDDSNAFDKKYLKNAKEILFKLIGNMEDDEDDLNDDLVTLTLNSNNGKIFHALLNYTLRYGRLNSSNAIKWEEDIKSFFTKELEEKNNHSKSVFTILGNYLPNLIFLDKDWVETNFNKIFPLENDKLWEISIEGYFRYSATVYTDIYQLFKENKHLEKALKYTFKSEEIKEKIIQHICIVYFAGKDDKTIFELIESKKQKSIVSLIYFIWGNSGYKDDRKAIEKVHKLWAKIYEVFKDDKSEDSFLIFSALSRWFIFLNEINDDIMPALKQTMKHVEKDHNSFFITEEFSRLVCKNAKYIGELYLEMLSNGIYPSYKEEDILSTIENLYKSGEAKKALTICNEYKREGIYFLNELSKKYKDAIK